MEESIVAPATVVDGLDDCDWKPKFGMSFDSEQAAYEFYNAYGGRVGFSIRRDYYNKNKYTNEITSRVFVCNKEGFRANDRRDHLIKNPRQDVRTGCEARLTIKLDRSNGKYLVKSFNEKHNHALVVPECTHMLPSQRKISPIQALEVELAEQSGISLSSAFELMGRQAGGRESLGFTKLDQKNYLRSKRQTNLAYGEAGSILKYFQKRTLDNPSFFHAVQLDIEEQITNIFWADAQMIMDYGQFGDALSFDTTYKINKEHRPFAVFVGFNHHREIIVFGAALMYDETIDSFIWLFETFLEAMSNKTPKTIFTDQDAAMAKAISTVMLETYHRLCTWHLMQNALKHVNCIFKGPGEVRGVLKKFMKHIEGEEEFLVAWDEMLDKYGARENNWLRLTFGIKEKWGWPYVRRAWSAGMSTTQLSESFNAKLKKYLKSDFDLLQFFMHFERVLNDKRYTELEAEYALSQKLPRVKINVKMLKQAGDLYTKTIFEEFQDEYVKSIEACIESSVDDNEAIVFTITDDDGKERKVKKEMDGTLICSCRKFELKGIMYSHTIKVLREAMQIKDLPDQYILKRWTKKARAESLKDSHGHTIQADIRLHQTERYRSLCSIYTRLSSRASESQETYDLLVAKGHELSIMIEGILSLRIDGKMQVNDDQPCPSNPCEGSFEVDCQDNTNLIQAKGLKKRESTGKGRRRIKSSLEIALAKKKKLSNAKSIQGSSVSTSTGQDVYIPQPPPPFPMGANNVCPPLFYPTYMGCDVPNSKSWMPYKESQHNSFQALLQQNTTDFEFSFQDSQASNSTSHIQVIDLNMNDQMHGSSNSDHFGNDG